MAGEDLTAGASSSIGAAQQSQQNPNAILQLLQHLVQSGGAGQSKPLEGGLVNFGTQVQQPQAPARIGTPDIQYPNRPGGYNTKGERQRDEKASLFHGIASTVRTFAEHETDKKVREMSLDTSRLMTAIQAHEAAAQSGDQAAAKQNADIINDMLGDPKKRKQFEKAFNVNLLGESKDKDSPEYKGFIEAFKKFKSGESDLNPQAQKFVQQMPKTPQLNPQAQAQAQAVKAGVLPSADVQAKAGAETQKNLVELDKILTESKDKELTNENKMKIATMLANSRDERSQAMIYQQVLKNQGSKAVANLHVKATEITANAHLEGIETNQKWATARDFLNNSTKRDLAADPNIKALNSVVNNYDKKIKELNDQMKVAAKAEDAPRMQLLTKQIEAAKKVQDSIIAAAEKNIPGITDAEKDEDQKEEELTPEENKLFEEMFKD